MLMKLFHLCETKNGIGSYLVSICIIKNKSHEKLLSVENQKPKISIISFLLPFINEAVLSKLHFRRW